jgi:hypothetical protein
MTAPSGTLKLVVDPGHGTPIGTVLPVTTALPPAKIFVGVQPVLGKGRIIRALPLHDGPVLVAKSVALADPSGWLLGDGFGAVVSSASAQYIHRLLHARPVVNTRGL